MRIDVLNGVNLNLLGRRDQSIYGSESIQDLETQIYAWARELDLQVRCRQTNNEGEYVGFLHQALGTADGLIVNPGAWTHYSWAIHDALEPFDVPFVEVHLSNVDEREEWRRHSVLTGLGGLRIVGKGFDGYREALGLLNERRPCPASPALPLLSPSLCSSRTASTSATSRASRAQTSPCSSSPAARRRSSPIFATSKRRARSLTSRSSRRSATSRRRSRRSWPAGAWASRRCGSPTSSGRRSARKEPSSCRPGGSSRRSAGSRTTRSSSRSAGRRQSWTRCTRPFRTRRS